jgi:hypothetical protein
MDDMRAYIVERHAEELAKLTVEAANVRPTSKYCAAEWCSLPVRAPVATLQESLVHEELSLSSVVEISLERALVSRFLDRIVACLKKPTKYVVQPSHFPPLAHSFSCHN